MASFRFSQLAEGDLAMILAASGERWGPEGRRRYASCIAVAIRKVATHPLGPATRDRSELSPGIRSFHLRHAHTGSPDSRVKQPVHVLYYRVVAADLVEIVRVLHERMEPGRHLPTY